MLGMVSKLATEHRRVQPSLRSCSALEAPVTCTKSSVCCCCMMGDHSCLRSISAAPNALVKRILPTADQQTACISSIKRSLHTSNQQADPAPHPNKPQKRHQPKHDRGSLLTLAGLQTRYPAPNPTHKLWL